MPALPSPTARRLDRLDEQVRQLRVLLLEMAVSTSVPTSDLRNSAFEACVSAGLLTSPHCSFLVSAWFSPVDRGPVFALGDYD